MAQKWPTPITVGRALRDLGADFVMWRKLQGLTAGQVAERAAVSRGTLLRLENGSGTVSLENMLRIARALGVMDALTKSIDPYATDVGKMRSEERLPKRVRHPRNIEDPDA